MGPAYPASRRVIAVRQPPCPPPMMTTCLFASALFMAASRGRIWLMSLHFDNTTVAPLRQVRGRWSSDAARVGAAARAGAAARVPRVVRAAKARKPQHCCVFREEPLNAVQQKRAMRNIAARARAMGAARYAGAARHEVPHAMRRSEEHTS